MIWAELSGVPSRQERGALRCAVKIETAPDRPAGPDGAEDGMTEIEVSPRNFSIVPFQG